MHPNSSGPCKYLNFELTSQPLSLEALVLKKILQLDMKVKSLPPGLKIKAEKFFKSKDRILPFINERGQRIMERDFWQK